MSGVVVDACVVAKLLFPEADSDACDATVRDLVAGGATLCAPDLLFVEVANVAWKKVRRGEATPDDAREAFAIAARLGIRTVEARGLAPAGLEAALATGCTAYDGLYVALALERDAVLVTADGRLARAATEVLGAARVIAIGGASATATGRA